MSRQSPSGLHVVIDKGLEDSDGVVMAMTGTGGLAEMMTVNLASEIRPVDSIEVLGAPVKAGGAAAEVAEDKVEVAAMGERITNEEVGMNSKYIFSLTGTTPYTFLIPFSHSQVPKITTPTDEPSEALTSANSTEQLCTPQLSSGSKPPGSSTAPAFIKHESDLPTIGESIESAETVSKKRAREETDDGPEIAKKPNLKSGEGLES